MTDPQACGHDRPTADPGSDCLICASVWASTGAPTVPGQIQDAYCAHGDESPEVGSGSVAVDTANAHLRACENALLDGGTPDPRTEAKAAKPQPQLVPFGFVMAMGGVFAEGLTDGRKPHGWQALDSAQVAHDYRGALLRHYAKGEWAAVAVNAAILWWHERKAKQ